MQGQYTSSGCIRYALAWSNVLGVPAVALANKGSDRLMIVCIIVASCMMHMTETKHGLGGHMFTPIGQLCLNVDRLVAIFAALYFLPSASLIVIGTATIGAIFMLIGEYRTDSVPYNRIVYPVCHLVWHASIYAALTVFVCTDSHI